MTEYEHGIYFLALSADIKQITEFVFGVNIVMNTYPSDQ
jgi:hypothetical protein